ncbi:sugar phosphate isomerase/epimerase family protein [Listeria ivanovii]|uniref:sugar phosphate isomerase/epimerase family protein n=1 Tax=Listeria ivanovii TaxID=1638 RepID=UPI00065DE73D|nr:sugar phosphate isomerase/epimerase [Listeria ivanovii]
MKLGIFSKIFADEDLEVAFQKIKAFGLTNVQFNFANLGLASLPDTISKEDLNKIQQATERQHVNICAISATFNTLELDKSKHQANLIGFETVVKAAKTLHVPVVTISAGSFNQADFWSPHPDNHTEKAWNYLISTLTPMISIAEKHGVIIAFEPEQANVISTVEDGIKLINHFESDNLRILFDAANIINTKNADNMLETIKKSIDISKKFIVLAHCKDILATTKQVSFAPVGQGNLPLNDYLDYLAKVYNGPVIMHGLEKNDIEIALNYLHK